MNLGPRRSIRWPVCSSRVLHAPDRTARSGDTANAGAIPRRGGGERRMSRTGEAVSVVLVHGGFVDGSGWLGVYAALRRQGHRVTVVQNPTLSLADDVMVTKRAIDELQGP